MRGTGQLGPRRRTKNFLPENSSVSSAPAMQAGHRGSWACLKDGSVAEYTRLKQIIRSSSNSRRTLLAVCGHWPPRSFSSQFSKRRYFLFGVRLSRTDPGYFLCGVFRSSGRSLFPLLLRAHLTTQSELILAQSRRRHRLENCRCRLRRRRRQSG